MPCRSLLPAIVVAALLVQGGPETARAGEKEARTRVLVVADPPARPVTGVADDLFVLRAFLDATETYAEQPCKPADLGKADLKGLRLAVLLNVGELSDDAVKKLEGLVKDGGGLVLFLGDRVKAAHYNDTLFKVGLFPVKVEERPFDPLAANFADTEERRKERRRRLEKSGRPNLLLTDERHPAIAGLARSRVLFRSLAVDVYWKALPRAKWDADGKQTQVLATLPYAGPAAPFEKPAQKLLDDAVAAVAHLADSKAALKPHLQRVRQYRRDALVALAADEPIKFAAALDARLTDTGEPKDPDRPDLRGLWQEAGLRDLKGKLAVLRDQAQHGDPLVVARQTGKGRVVAVLTAAGSAPLRGVGREEAVSWCNWSTGRGVASTYPVFLLGLFRHAGGAPAAKD